MEIKFRVKGFARKSYPELKVLDVIGNGAIEMTEHLLVIPFNDDVSF